MAQNNDFMDLYDGLNSNSLSKAEFDKLNDIIRANPEIENQYKDFQLIDKGIAEDFEAFNPSPELKESVFKGLGLSVPQSFVVNVATKSPFIGFVKKAVIPVAAAIVVGLFTFNSFQHSDYNNNYADSSIQSTGINANSLQSDNSKDNSKNKNEITKSENPKYPVSKNSNVSSNHKAKINNAFSDSDGLADGSRSNPEINPADNKDFGIQQSNNSNLDAQQVSQSFSALSYSNSRPASTPDMNPPSNNGAGFTNSFSIFSGGFELKNSFVTLRGIAGTTFSSGYNFTNSLYNSVSIGVYTNMLSSDNFAVGIEGGFEPFEKKYFDKWETAKLVSIDNPSMFWGALGLRYSSNTYIIPSIKAAPFGTFLIGASELGPLSKLLVGLDYDVSKTFTFYTALEGTMVFYQNKVEWLASKKLSFTAGISYHF